MNNEKSVLPHCADNFLASCIIVLDIRIDTYACMQARERDEREREREMRERCERDEREMRKR